MLKKSGETLQKFIKREGGVGCDKLEKTGDGAPTEGAITEMSNRFEELL
jgi:hypothetical protein